jgi:hypothetical protein
MDRAEVEVICGFVMDRYLRRPPPPPERARDAPTLLDPRWLLLRAALLLGRLLAAPPKALPFREEPWLLGMLRLPTRSPPPALAVPRFAPTLLVPRDAPARFAPALPLRLALVAGCVRADAPEFCRAADCRVDIESPRAVPP